MSKYTALVEDAAHMARSAGEVIRKAYDQSSVIKQKGLIDLVTDTDHAAEKCILDYLIANHPDSSVLAEESGSRSGDSEIRWIVDPLDGTVNFAHRIPHFCVLVAAQFRNENGTYETVAGATYDPMRDEMFLCEHGQGASLNGNPIHVSSKENLIDSLLTTGFGYDRLYKKDDNHAEFCRLNLLSRGVRRLGSAGLDLAYVAAGRFDGFWEYALNPWDQAAGQLLVREAGGVVTDMKGRVASVDAESIAVAGTGLHEKLLQALDSATKHSVNSREELGAFLPEDQSARLREVWGA